MVVNQLYQMNARSMITLNSSKGGKGSGKAPKGSDPSGGGSNEPPPTDKCTLASKKDENCIDPMPKI